MNKGTSPSSSGPSGSHFEGQVGASFLLSLLVGGEPRGLPGTIIDRVAFQRADEGHPLDDVVVYAHDAEGQSATLEIQVKKGVTFAPSDPIFRSVVGQIAEASRKPEFLNSRYELAIAISRRSHKIDGAYQDVLTWARQIGDAATFMKRINRRGSANDDMRGFVNTFRAHLQNARAAHDGETIWSLLRRLQILVFDFTAAGSASEQLGKECAVRALHPDDTPRAGELWKVLTELSIKIASSAGDRTRDQLMAELRQESFRLAEHRRNFSARVALAEASRNALADIRDQVGGAMLTRHERVAAVHAALDAGRYVEIRGDAGVGKSAVLKHFAQETSTEAQVIVLSPSRTVPKGWLAMRATLGFDSTAHDLLSDLAGNGSALLFLDNLDFFNDEERLTVNDLVRVAAKVPGMSVIATARRDFGITEPTWLPAEALDELGRSEPVLINELSDHETEELRNAAPQLRGLLADNHPARQVARNMFRLSRLASLPSDAPLLRTEAEMAKQWWQTADGRKDQTHRDRARILNALAEQAISRAEQLDVRTFKAAAVDALVTSETLRDLGSDRVSFRHDVLTEWAIANLLFSDLALLEKMRLDGLAPARLARGVELAVRMTIEDAADGTRWKSFLDVLSKNENHSSWRRAALLALVRSEIAPELLKKASTYLLEGKAQMLREMIRIVMAVDVESGTKRFSALGVDPKYIPANLNVPSGPSWSRLILWLLTLGESLPAAVIPDVTDLYIAWSFGTLGQDPLTPLLVQWLYRWLMEIETAHNQNRRAFQGELSGQVSALAESLKTGFLTFCNRAPKLATDYLQWLRAHEDGEETLRGILKFRGALPQAAPRELAEITAELLIRRDEEDDESPSSPFRDAFGYHDTDFIPASPSQGPFLELLVHSPESGLKLIRQLIDHAVSFKSGGKHFGENAIRISFLDGSQRTFPWVQSYNWSRDVGSGPTITTCALMALEAWGHRRIEGGETIEKVISEILSGENAPAAYLLVAVDLLLSHWPKSNIVAIPFLACPELLCLDRQRTIHDNMEFPDIFGLKALQKEPIGPTTLDSLKSRPSRGRMLDQLLPYYALDESIENRKALAELLRKAISRLGTPKEQSDLGDPEFMAVHALNQIDPNNWQKRSAQTPDGTAEFWEYVPPEAEARHLQPLQDAARQRQADAAMEANIRVALNDTNRSSRSFASAAIEWAQKRPIDIGATEQNDSQHSIRRETIVTAAMIGARDGGAELIATHETWLRDIFIHALTGKEDAVHRMRSGLQFNPIAIGFVGIALLLRNRFDFEAVRTLLESAGNDNPAAAHGFAATAGLLTDIDERLPRAVLRCAFAARTTPRRNWRMAETEHISRNELHRQEVVKAIEAEMAWLMGNQDEPGWPEFTPSPARPRRRFLSRRNQRKESIEEPVQPDVYVDHQAAALWLGSAASLFSVSRRPWLRDIIKTYGSWTYLANGSELEAGEDSDRGPTEWNSAFFKLLACALPGLTLQQIDEIALGPITNLPDQAFFDIATSFLREVDTVYFNNEVLEDAQALHVRSMLAKKIMATRAWARHVRDRSTSTEIHFGPAVAVVLFNDYYSFQPPKCYLFAKAIDRLGPFIPLLKEVAEYGQFFLLATTLLNLIEVAPRATHLPIIVAAGKAWLSAYPDDKIFWIDQSSGRRLCSIMQAIFSLTPKSFGLDQPSRKEIDALLSNLIRMGVSEAHRLEESLLSISGIQAEAT
jgi:hypothetical protein